MSSKDTQKKQLFSRKAAKLLLILKYGIKQIKYIPLIPWYFRTKRDFSLQNQQMEGAMRFDSITFHPIFSNRDACAGSVNSYLIQDLWGAQKVNQLDSKRDHYDIGSRVDGFIASLLAFRGNVTLIDIRPLPYSVDDSRLKFVQSDATLLEAISDNSVYSLSALCSLEHFGLGRYGDPIDAMACFKAFDSIQRVMERGGHIYLSVPVGKPRVAFNAHRIFDPYTIKDCFNCCELVEFSVITGTDPAVPLIRNADMDLYRNAREVMGLFEFVKK